MQWALNLIGGCFTLAGVFFLLCWVFSCGVAYQVEKQKKEQLAVKRAMPQPSDN